jgi:hypothetical protein
MYKIWDINNKKFIWSRDVVILENKYINNKNNNNILDNDNEIELEVENIRDTRDVRDIRDVRDTNIVDNNNNTSSNINNNIIEDNDNISNWSIIDNISENGNIPNLQETSSSYTINNNNIDNSAFDMDELALIINLNNEPNNYKEAISSPNNKEWIEAIQKEIDKLNRQNT